MQGPASLAEFSGTGVLQPEEDHDGVLRLTGHWQADDPERAYEELHRLYMGRERIRYRGPVRDLNGSLQEEGSLEVFILQWTDDQHPAGLKLQEAGEEF